MNVFQLSTPALAAIAATLLVVYKLVATYLKSPKAPGIGYGSVPLVGPYRGAIRFLKDPKGALREGASKYKGGYFKVATHTTEYTIVADRAKVAEYLSAPDDVLSFHDSVNDFLQTEWTLGYGVAHRMYHVALVRTRFTQTIAASTPAMYSELQDCIATLVGSPSDWTEVPLYATVVKMVARVSNNAFTGQLFCRNEAYLENAIAYAQSVVISAEIIRLFPNWLKPLVASLTPFRKIQKQAQELMGPLVQKRLDTNWDEEKDKPNDMIQILIDAAPPVERTMPQIVERMMTLNMASIHTTTMTTTGAIYKLAAEHEKYVPALREECEQYSIDGKIDKMALGKLTKLDSFLREVGRTIPLGLIALVRVARQEYTFKDGMKIPKGAAVAAPIELLHNEAADVTNPDEFDGFRYSNMRGESTGMTKHQMVNTDLNYLLFGHGKHAW